MGKKIKVAIVIRGFHNGGIEKVFESYLSHMDRSDFELHFVTHMKNLPEKKQLFTDMGCVVHELSPLRGHRLTARNLREYRQLFAENQFDVVHNNVPDNLLPLLFAKQKKVPCRILHAHNIYTAGYEKKNPLVAKLFKMGFAFNTANATDLVSVSKDAALSAFGEKRAADAVLLPNAIKTRRFAFNPQVREEMRRSLGVEDSYVVGHIGRYETEQKNQEFVLESFRQLLTLQPDSRLVMIGDGARLETFRAMAADLGIADRVNFTGNIVNVPDCLQAMDVFVLPSRKEGLGIVAVEAQAAGLYCLLSDKVPAEAAVTQNAEFLPIDDAAVWGRALSERRGKLPVREGMAQAVADAGYDISAQAEKLADLYRSRTV